MRNKFQKSKANICFFTSIIVSVIIIVVLAAQGSKQNNNFVGDYNIYIMCEQLVSKNNYAQADANFRGLLKDYPHNYYLLWDYAYILQQEGKLSEAYRYYSAVRAQRPAVVLDPQYLLEFGALLNERGQYDSGKQYLIRAKELGDQQIANRADYILSTDNVKNSKGN